MNKKYPPGKYPEKVIEAANNQDIDLDTGNVLVITSNFGHGISQFEKVSIEIVKIDAKAMNDEVYPQNGNLGLTAKSIMNISNALGIRWDWSQTGIIQATGVERIAKAVGAIRNSHSEWLPTSASKSIDIENYEFEVRAKYEEEADRGDCRKGWDGKYEHVAKWGEIVKNNGEKKSYPIFSPWESEKIKREWIENQTRKEVSHFRKSANEKAETGAMLRAIRKLVPLKNTYRVEELSKPFYLPRIVIDTEKTLALPGGQRMIMDRAAGASASVFGFSSPMTTAMATVEPIPVVDVAPEEPQDDNEPRLKKVRDEIMNIIETYDFGEKTVVQLKEFLTIANANDAEENLEKIKDWVDASITEGKLKLRQPK
jgi:hypothetical protein